MPFIKCFFVLLAFCIKIGAQENTKSDNNEKKIVLQSNESNHSSQASNDRPSDKSKKMLTHKEVREKKINNNLIDNKYTKQYKAYLTKLATAMEESIESVIYISKELYDFTRNYQKNNILSEIIILLIIILSLYISRYIFARIIKLFVKKFRQNEWNFQYIKFISKFFIEVVSSIFVVVPGSILIIARGYNPIIIDDFFEYIIVIRCIYLLLLLAPAEYINSGIKKYTLRLANVWYLGFFLINNCAFRIPEIYFSKVMFLVSVYFSYLIGSLFLYIRNMAVQNLYKYENIDINDKKARRDLASKIENKDKTTIFLFLLFSQAPSHIISIVTFAAVVPLCINYIEFYSINFIFVIILNLLLIFLAYIIILKVEKKSERQNNFLSKAIYEKKHILRFSYYFGVFAYLVSNIMSFIIPTAFFQVILVEKAIKLSMLYIFMYTLINILESSLNHYLNMRYPLSGQFGANASSLSIRLHTIGNIFRGILKIFAFFVTILLTISIVGYSVTPILGGLGVVSFAISFGVQSLIKDFVSGFFILIEDLVAIGDSVKIGSMSGVVENIFLRNIYLRNQENGALIIIPFGSITTLENRSRDYSFITLHVSVGYDENVDKVKSLISKAINSIKSEYNGYLIEEEPDITGIADVTDYSTIIRVRIKTIPKNRKKIKLLLNQTIKELFDLHNIKVPTPPYDPSDSSPNPSLTNTSSKGFWN